MALAIAFACAVPARAWDAEGHAAVALVAEQNLSAGARAHVVKILGSDDLASIASWMDQVRAAYFHQGPLGSDPEALKFNAEFPKNGEWHYVEDRVVRWMTSKEAIAQGLDPSDVGANIRPLAYWVEVTVDVGP